MGGVVGVTDVAGVVDAAGADLLVWAAPTPTATAAAVIATAATATISLTRPGRRLDGG